MTRHRSVRTLLAVPIALTLFAAACSDDGGDEEGSGGEGSETSESQSGTLARVIENDQLVCGVNDAVPGFGLDVEGEFEGFDIEFCRVVAAAVLGDAEKVEYRPLTAEQRFTALQDGQIDVLIRNTTFTASRDGTEGSNFVTTTFYDGQGMMVNADSDFQSIEDMDGATICVLSGTTTELNLATAFDSAGVSYTPRTFTDNEEIQPEFEAGACQGWTSDLSQLAGVRSAWPDNQGGPDGLRILDDTMSKEPLGPVVRDGDQEWADAVNWAVISTIQAEEFGINSENISEMMDEENPDIQRFLGQAMEPEEGEEGEAAPFDPELGLPTDFAVQVIEQVGNYGEIYDRTVGPDTALGLERTTNALWTDGGLLYAPPYR